MIKQNGPADLCLFDLILYVPVNIFSHVGTDLGSISRD